MSFLLCSFPLSTWKADKKQVSQRTASISLMLRDGIKYFMDIFTSRQPLKLLQATVSVWNEAEVEKLMTQEQRAKRSERHNYLNR